MYLRQITKIFPRKITDITSAIESTSILARYISLSSPQENNAISRPDSDMSDCIRKNQKPFYHNHRMPKKEIRTVERKPLEAPNWANITLPPIKKNCYEVCEATANRHDEDVKKFRSQCRTEIRGSPLKPIINFEELKLNRRFLEDIRKHKYAKPTPVQSETWPVALSGRNVVGIAQTGSGKTLAYVLPALVHIKNQSLYRYTTGPIALILVPTRELARQIQQVTNEYAFPQNIRNCCVYGGTGKPQQARDLIRGCEILIATPGRLIDFLESNTTNLKRCTYVVLDEADRMLDMGFESQLRTVMQQIRPDAQTLMFSASWPKQIRKLAEDYLCKYSHIKVGAQPLTANPNIKQVITICEEMDKGIELNELMEAMVKNSVKGKILIFVGTKRKADYICADIQKMGIKACSLHGDKSQSERESALKSFRRGFINVMVATDVASRGLDIEDIKYVVNYDFPQSIEDYVHRIGRTARAGASGTAITFFTEENAAHAYDLVEIMKEANQEIPSILVEMSHRRGKNRNLHTPDHGPNIAPCSQGSCSFDMENCCAPNRK